MGSANTVISQDIAVSQSVHCNVCGADDTMLLWRPQRAPGPVVRCRNCGLVYANPRLTKSMINGPILGDSPQSYLTSCRLEDAAQRWEWPIIQGYEREERAKRKNARAVLHEMAGLGYTGGQLLDIGCFVGQFLDEARAAGWSVRGLEPLAGPAIYARATFGLDVTTDILSPSLFSAASFDAVTTFQVFEHLPDPANYLAQIHRLLRPNGLLVVETPRIDTIWTSLLGQWNRAFALDHFYYFSAKTMGALLARHGFAVKRITRPTRWLSLRHVAQWVSYLTGMKRTTPAGNALAGAIVPINLGDILRCYAVRV